MRNLMICWLALALGVVLVGRAEAQDAGRAQRLELAQTYVELSMGDEVDKLVTQMVEQQLAETPDMSPEERDWMRRNMPTLTRNFIDDLSRDLAAEYADTFTTPELEALIAFYGTPMGRSIATKQFELGVRSEEVMLGSLVRFLGNLEAKFCAEFDCGDVPTTVPSAK